MMFKQKLIALSSALTFLVTPSIALAGVIRRELPGGVSNLVCVRDDNGNTFATTNLGTSNGGLIYAASLVFAFSNGTVLPVVQGFTPPRAFAILRSAASGGSATVTVSGVAYGVSPDGSNLYFYTLPNPFADAPLSTTCD